MGGGGQHCWAVNILGGMTEKKTVNPVTARLLQNISSAGNNKDGRGPPSHVLHLLVLFVNIIIAIIAATI